MQFIRKEPLPIDALEWDGTNREEIEKFCEKARVKPDFEYFGDGRIWIETVFGFNEVNVGGFLIMDEEERFDTADAQDFLSAYIPLTASANYAKA